MPKFTDDLQAYTLNASNYGFSATKIDDLGATEYTLATVIVDSSGSVAGFKTEMETAVSEIVSACKYSPRADNLMLRVVEFNTNLDEIHGFKLLENTNPGSYAGCLNIGGATALYDATENGISATASYGKTLTDSDYGVNAIVFVITDGDDNSSALTRDGVKQALAKMAKDESLESVVTVLIGVNVNDRQISQYLTQFKNEVGFTQYVELNDAKAKTLAKLAQFVSRSISAQSQALGTGGPSQSLTF